MQDKALIDLIVSVGFLLIGTLTFVAIIRYKVSKKAADRVKRVELNADLLRKEYLNWFETHGDGRNQEDLRFGQFVFSKYKLFFPNHSPDGFNTESATQAYKIIGDILGSPGKPASA